MVAHARKLPGRRYGLVEREHAARRLPGETGAPCEGVIGNRAVAQGDYVSRGERLLAVAPVEGVYGGVKLWETPLVRLKKTAPVEISCKRPA
jgi:multidrug resistance efflux pump